MDAERKVAAAIFLTAVGKHRRWKGEQIYHPKMELEKRSSIEEEVI